jgi:uncharacterized protein
MDNATPPPGTPPPSSPLPPPNPTAHRTWDMWCHMSALAGLVFPTIGTLLGPLIVWQMKRNEFPSVDEHGKESFNFQLSVFIYVLIGAVLGFLGSFICIGFFIWLAAAAIHYGAIILAIIAGIKANDGILYRYPLTIRFVK